MRDNEKAAIGQVDLWVQDLDAPCASVAELIQVLSPYERTRASRFHFERDHRRFVVARSTLRALVSHYIGLAAGRVEFIYGLYGKPSLSPASASTPLHFNLSHTENILVIAVSRTHEVGVDCEVVRDDFPVDEVIPRFFCPAECRFLHNLDSDVRRDRFFMLWTRKEAYIKARGWGLSLDPVRLDASADAAAQMGLNVMIDGNIDSEVFLHELVLAPRVKTSLAVIGGPVPIVVRSHTDLIGLLEVK